VFLADHPTTGGYPVVAVVDPVSMGACAQARPGTMFSFRWVSPAGGRPMM
jgi:allophanate hydrolase subunit 2